MPHAMHEPPAAPHAEAEGVVQVDPEQHPFGQEVPLQLVQAPALQMRPMQSWHVAPPAPHCDSTLPGSHVLPSQQPLHDWGSHTQWPLTQA